MRVLIDTDVVLDLMLKRTAFFADAFAVWKAGDQGRYERYVAAMTPVKCLLHSTEIPWRTSSTTVRR